ncbi:hypothetical protein [Paludibacter sp.]|uniref:hypothetical protein n=1 Tax=Paludibacter sp. TaxID=1898105 RepID=UPI0013527DDD|nr:hypothetical protein [Paludibacter sp.]MTK53996.1 hypothetical protein [Paludibacter sp.]
MNKEVLLALIDKDIKELAILNKGFAENDIVSATILGLAKTKAENILTGLAQLGEMQNTPQPVMEATPKETAISSVVDETPFVPVPEPEKVIELELDPEIETVIEPEIPAIPEPAPVEPTPVPEAEPVEETKPEEEQPKHSLAEVLNTNGHSLNDQLVQKSEPSLANILSNSKVEDLRQALSLAERFRFQRELFNGNGEKMNTTLSLLNAMKTEEEAVAYLSTLGWQEEDVCAGEFKQLVHRKFL